MSPVEFYYSIKAVGDFRRAQAQHNYEVARYSTVLIINNTSTIMKERITDVRETLPFPWEEAVKKEQQSMETLKRRVQGMALALGAIHTDKDPDDPPRVLAPKFRK